MNYIEYKIKRNELKEAYNRELLELDRAYTNAEVDRLGIGVGDVVIDHIGAIEIEKIKSHRGGFSNPETPPQFAIFGRKLNTLLRPAASGQKRWIFSSDLICKKEMAHDNEG